MSVLLIRLDKIGDLVCTLPVDEILNVPFAWVINESLEPIAAAAAPPRAHYGLSVKPENWRASFRQLRQILREKKPKAVVIFFAPWWVSLACFLARVPLRAGRLSQWHSFLFFNRGVRQQRTLSAMHEADYNLQLLRKSLPEFCKPTLPNERAPLLTLQAPLNAHVLSRLNLQAGKYAVVHPGMFGSALNWPSERYDELVSELTKNTVVVITGTDGDLRFLATLQKNWGKHSQVRWAVGQLNLSELLGVLYSANFVVAPSTGVLHLSASLGTKSIGIYSPVLVHHPRRWGPRGREVKVLLPQNEGPDCMNTISVAEVLQSAQ